MIIGQEKPDLDELVHFGVKGMKWGVRQKNRSERMERSKEVRKATYDKKKGIYKKAGNSLKSPTAKKIAFGTTVAVGAVVSAAIMKKVGDNLVSAFQTNIQNQAAMVNMDDVQKWTDYLNGVGDLP